MRRCSFHQYSKCSTSIPVHAVDHLLAEFGKNLDCPTDQKQRIQGKSKIKSKSANKGRYLQGKNIIEAIRR